MSIYTAHILRICLDFGENISLTATNWIDIRKHLISSPNRFLTEIFFRAYSHARISIDIDRKYKCVSYGDYCLLNINAELVCRMIEPTLGFSLSCFFPGSVLVRTQLSWRLENVDHMEWLMLFSMQKHIQLDAAYVWCIYGIRVHWPKNNKYWFPFWFHRNIYIGR